MAKKKHGPWIKDWMKNISKVKCISARLGHITYSAKTREDIVNEAKIERIQRLEARSNIERIQGKLRRNFSEERGELGKKLVGAVREKLNLKSRKYPDDLDHCPFCMTAIRNAYWDEIKKNWICVVCNTRWEREVNNGPNEEA